MPITKPSKFSSQNNGKYADLISLGQWKQGIVNRLSASNLPNDALFDALNVDLDIQGLATTRKKYTKIADGNFKSLKTVKGITFVVKNNNLSIINKDFSISNLLNNFSFSNDTYYTELFNEVYISNGISTAKYNKANNIESWSIKSPEFAPQVIATAENTGGLKKGRYLIAYTYLYGKFETSASPFYEINVPYDDFTFEVDAVISSTSTNACFYISQTNGKELWKAKIGYSVNLDRLDNYGIPLQDDLLDGIPPMMFLTKSNGRIFGVVESDILYTEVENPRQYNPASNRIYVDNSVINMLIGVDNGLYVGTELATYFIQTTNPKDPNTSLIKLSDFPVIEGTNFEDIKNRKVGWLSTEGYIVGDQNGKIENLTKDKLDFSKNYTKGAVLFKEIDTNKQVIFSLQQEGSDSSLQSSDWKNEHNNQT